MNLKEYEKDLKGEYLRIYKEIKKELKSNELIADYLEEENYRIADMLLDLQDKKKDLNKFIGADIKEFCNEIILNYHRRDTFKYKFYKLIIDLLIMIPILSVMQMVVDKHLYVEVSTTFLIMISAVIGGNLIAEAITCKIKSPKKRVKWNSNLKYLSMLILISLALMTDMAIKNTVYFKINILLILGGCVIGFIFIYGKVRITSVDKRFYEAMNN